MADISKIKLPDGNTYNLKDATAYAHSVTNKGSAFASGFYKITTNAEGHVTAATAVTKADITGLGIPAQDTDTKQNVTLNTTSKAFITGVTTTPTSSAQALTGIADTGVYLTSNAGEISAVRQSFNSAGTEKAYITYNTTTNALDFIFQ